MQRPERSSPSTQGRQPDPPLVSTWWQVLWGWGGQHLTPPVLESPGLIAWQDGHIEAAKRLSAFAEDTLKWRCAPISEAWPHQWTGTLGDNVPGAPRPTGGPQPSQQSLEASGTSDCKIHQCVGPGYLQFLSIKSFFAWQGANVQGGKGRDC